MNQNPLIEILTRNRNVKIHHVCAWVYWFCIASIVLIALIWIQPNKELPSSLHELRALCIGYACGYITYWCRKDIKE